MPLHEDVHNLSKPKNSIMSCEDADEKLLNCGTRSLD